MSSVHPWSLLSAYHDGEVTSEERATVDSHIAGCPDCRARLAEYRRIGAGIRELPRLAPPATLHRDVWTGISRRQGNTGLGPTFAGVLRLGAVAAVVLLAAFGLWRVANPEPGGVAANMVEPQPDKTDVQLNSSIRIEFSEPMVQLTSVFEIERQLVSVFPDDPAWTARWIDADELEITPEGEWGSGRTYTITVRRNARAQGGAVVNDDIIWKFSTTGPSPTPTTTETPEPTATATVPALEPTLAPTDTPVQVPPTNTAEPTAAPTETATTQPGLPTVTPRPSNTPAPPTNTPPAQATATGTTEPPQPSGTPEITPSAEPTEEETSTPRPSATPADETATAEPSEEVPSRTATPEPSATRTPGATATADASGTPQPTETAEPGISPTAEPTATGTPGLFVTPSATAEPVEPTETPGLLLTPSATPGPGDTYTVCGVEMRSGFGRVYRNNEAIQADLGCPEEREFGPEAAQQYFEHGHMFWRGDTRRIYVFNRESKEWQSFADTWVEGDQESAGLTPPQDLYEPVRGFGKIWREQEGVREALGWATELEHQVEAAWQDFEHGSMLWTFDGSIRVLLDDGTWGQYADE